MAWQFERDLKDKVADPDLLPVCIGHDREDGHCSGAAAQ
jgi:hypothetical protein